MYLIKFSCFFKLHGKRGSVAIMQFIFNAYSCIVEIILSFNSSFATSGVYFGIENLALPGIAGSSTVQG